MKRWFVRSSADLVFVCLLLGLGMGMSPVYGQTSQIPNGRFEDWLDVEDSAYFNPLFWSSLNEIHYLLGYEEFTVSPTNDALEGSLALRVETRKFCTADSIPVCFLVPGVAVLGDIFISPADLSITTFGVDFDDRPQAFTGWYKYLPRFGDSCLIEVELSRYNSDVNTREVIATGEFRESDVVSEYSPLSVDLTYFSTATPNKLRLNVYSGVIKDPYDGDLDQGSTLFLDWSDLGEPLILSAAVQPLAQADITIFPVPASHMLQIRWDQGSGGQVESGYLEVYDLTGRQVLSSVQVVPGQVNQSLDVSALQSGLYRLIYRDQAGRILDSRPFQVSR